MPTSSVTLAKSWRLRCWLLAMDALAFCGAFGSRAYLWCVDKASDATDWVPS